MTNPTPHGQVPEALIDLIDAYAETRHRYGRIHNAKTEAARNAVVEALSGVQALSAAPAEQQAAPKAAPASVAGQMQFGGCPECGSRSCVAQQCSRTVSHSAQVTTGVQWQCGQQASGFAAPQQEAQEPALFVSAKQLADLADPSHATAGSYLPARKTRAGLFTMALYTAPQPAPAPVSDDTKRLDWLDRNIFSREMSEWDAKYGHGPDYNMWVLFSPKGAHGTARDIIDAALAAQGGK